MCTLLGRFVTPDVYIELLVPQIRTGGGGAVQFRMGTLRVFASLVQGSGYAQTITSDHLALISDVLVDKEIMMNESVLLLQEVANVVSSVLKCQKGLIASEGKAGYQHFLVLASLDSAEGDAKVPGHPELKSKVFFVFGGSHLDRYKNVLSSWWTTFLYQVPIHCTPRILIKP